MRHNLYTLYHNARVKSGLDPFSFNYGRRFVPMDRKRPKEFVSVKKLTCVLGGKIFFFLDPFFSFR